VLCTVLGLEPSFDVPIVNVTVVAGQTAVLPCSVDSLDKYKVRAPHHCSLSNRRRHVTVDVMPPPLVPLNAATAAAVCVLRQS